MGWLVPLYTAGLAALSLPFLFHLIRRTPRGRQEFSSLMFLSPTPPKLTRRSRLDQLLLLALRLIALGLLTLAFTRPFLRESSALSPLDLPGRRVALLIDVSASMRRADLWTQAVQAAEKELAKLNPQDDVAMFTFDDRMQRIVEFESEGITDGTAKGALIRQKLQSLEPGWGATDLGTALVRLSSEMDSASDVHQAAREPLLVVISDLQKGARIDPLQGYEWPKHVAVALRLVATTKTTNAAVQLLADEEERGDAEPRVRVTNAADSTVDQFQVSWSADQSKSMRLNETAVYVPAGQSRVVRLPRAVDQLDADRIILKGDDQPFDNAFYVVPPRKQQAVVVYIGTDAVDNPRGMQFYLHLALANDPLRQNEIQARDGDKALSDLSNNSVRLAILTQPASNELIAALRSFVDRGGTLLCTPANRDAALSLPSLIEGLEIQAPSKRASQEFLLIGEVDFTHPLFAPFVGPRYADFTKIHFWKNHVASLAKDSSARSIMRFDDGSLALVEQNRGQGRVLALMSGWNPDDSQLALSSKFVPLMTSLIDLACGAAQGAATVTIHERVALPSANAAEALVVKIPGGKSATLAAGSDHFSATDAPGVYALQGGAGDTRFAVNLAAAESNTAPMETEQLEQRGVRLGATATRDERIDRLRQERDIELESRQKIWKVMLAAAVGVLLIETWLAGLADRKTRSGQPA